MARARTEPLSGDGDGDDDEVPSVLVDVELCGVQPQVRYARGTATLPAQVLGAYCLVEPAEREADAMFGEISNSDAIPLVVCD